MSDLVVWSICLPLLGAAATFVGPGRLAPAVGGAFALATAVTGAMVTWLVYDGGVMRHELGGWGAPLGVELYVDGLNVFMLGMTAVVALAISVASLTYFGVRDHAASGPGRWSSAGGYWPVWLTLWASMNLAFASADLFNLYIALELVGLSAVALMLIGRDTQVLTAAMRYLLASLMASLGYLLGVAMLYARYGTLDLYLIGAQLTGEPATWMAMALMSVGLFVKTALFPLHFWLPPAHSSAPGPVSAILSALVVKVSFYLLLRLWFVVFADLLSPTFGQVVGVLAAGAIVGGSVQAILQRRLKLLIAYSTVAQLGYMFLLVPLTIPYGGSEAWHGGAWSGGMYHMLSHALAKSAMFLAAAAVLLSVGSDRIRHFRGMAHELPVATFAFALAGVSLMGLPPSGGFVAKWFLVSAAIETGQWWWAVVILGGGLLTAAYIFMVIRYAFLPPSPPAFKPVPKLLQATAMVLALLAVLIGLRAVEPFALLEMGTPFVEAAHVGTHQGEVAE
ncbi:complex I subunit 5 family protein [Phycisphaerales bacterium AB-hyl4]|uniref:Complex I subunit 5 family protein n=1 Tax=Natronomicrosphaera hydrolytica TaxID=3242702 RepID=A0ABV4U9J0_9BACT